MRLLRLDLAEIGPGAGMRAQADREPEICLGSGQVAGQVARVAAIVDDNAVPGSSSCAVS